MLNIFLQKHSWKFLIISLLCGISLLYGFSHLILLHDNGWDYKNTVFITSLQAVDAYHYLGKLKEIYEGHYLLSNTYLTEHKGMQKSPWPRLPLYFTVAIGKFLHIEVQHLVVLMDFILPPIIFFLTYCFFRIFNIRQKLALLGATILILTPHLFKSDAFFSIIFNIIQNNLNFPILDAAFCKNCFLRPINPQLTFLFLLAAFLFFVKGLLVSRKYLLCSIFFGIITSYSYVFFSSYLYAFLGINALLFGIFRIWGYCRDSFTVLIITLIGSIPFLFSVFRLPEDKMREMQMSVASHVPILTWQVLFSGGLCSIIIICLIKGWINETKGIFSLSFLLSGIICLNQHVISGICVEPWHYDVFVIPQTTILALFLFIASFSNMNLIKNIKLPTRLVIILGSLVIIMTSFIFHPFFIVTFLSPDGILNPEFNQFLKIIHGFAFWGGTGGLLFATLLKTRWNVYIIKNCRILLNNILKNSRQLFKYLHASTVCYTVLIVFILLDISIVQYKNYNKMKLKFGYLQNVSSALKWLQVHTRKESVVLGSINYASTSGIIPIYTSNNVYIDQYAQYYFIPPMNELLDRFYNFMYLAGVQSFKDFENFLNDETSNRMFAGKFYPRFEEYRKKLGTNIYYELNKYRVDYFFYGPDEKRSFKTTPEIYPFLQKVYSDEYVTIYRIL